MVIRASSAIGLGGRGLACCCEAKLASKTFLLLRCVIAPPTAYHQIAFAFVRPYENLSRRSGLQPFGTQPFGTARGRLS
jgi:hypothetical protein